MTRKFTKSKALYSKAVRLIPGGVNSPVRAFRQVGGNPIYFKSAEGSRVTDCDGNTYIDFCQSWGPLILGHSHPLIVEAVQEAATKGLTYGACHPGEIQIADLILDGFPEFDRVRMVNSGTEAVMTALRIARGVTEKNLIVKFEGGYHGHFDGMLVKAGSGLVTHSIANSRGIPLDIAKTTMVTQLDNEEDVEETFRLFGDDIAAVIIEPLPANNGLLVQRKEFLTFLRKITSQYGTMLIYDEVISGFRLRFGGYYQETGTVPDMITLGKIIGGGLPVGAVLGKQEDMDELSPLGAVYQAGTLSGNPVALAAGIATLEYLKEMDPYEHLNHLTNTFLEAMHESGIPFAKAQSCGSIVWPYLDEGDLPRNPADISQTAMDRFTNMYWKLLEKGIYLPPSSFEVLFFSTAHTESDVVELAQSICSELEKEA